MHLKDLIEVLQEIVWLMGFGVIVHEISRVEMKKLLSKKKKNLVFSWVYILLMVAQKPIIHSIF